MPLNALQAHDADILRHCGTLIGVDEAGRGALAGPVVAGAVVLSRDFFASRRALDLSGGIDDSKKLTASQREIQWAAILKLREEGLLDVAVAAASVACIAEENILGATRRAMQSALELVAARACGWSLVKAGIGGPLFDAAEPPVRCLVDGRPLRPFPYKHDGLVKGDQLSLVVAMASIAAKVERDRLMCELAVAFPGYGFELHKGYGTAAHRKALRKLGASPAHRTLFLRKIIGPSPAEAGF